MDINIYTKTFNPGTADEETVKVVEIFFDDKVLRETFTYPSTISDANILTDVQEKLAARGYT